MHFAGQLAWIAYESILFLAWPVLYLYYFCRSRTDGKYSANYRARMGLNPPGSFRNGSGGAWVHALSLGETISSIPLILEIRRQKPSLRIIFSTATETGMTLALERLSGIVDAFFFMPHDFPWVVQDLVERVRPELFVLIETDSWPNLLRQLRKEKVFTALVNARISPGSYRRYCRLAGLAAMIFDGFDLIFSQTDLDKGRFESLGNLSGKVVSAGNLKFESSGRRIPEAEVGLLESEIGLGHDRSVWIAGSTHEGEEDMLLRVHRELKRRIPDLLLMIAPRNVVRRGELDALCISLGLTAGLRSRGDKVLGKDVYLIDTLGELAVLYSLCDIAFIGGSFLPLGGHNPLEALIQGKPIFWGPYFFNFHEIEAVLLASGCAARISSEDNVRNFLLDFFEHAPVRAEMIEAAENFCGFQQGTAARIASAVLSHRHKHTITP
jgi:3-deoxy-D-manno-octulosonic-acid transferase